MWRPGVDHGQKHELRDATHCEGLTPAARLQKPDPAAALLAPDMVEAILAGSADQSLMLERLERPLRASWEEQRERRR
jgi:hypothetical protein